MIDEKILITLIGIQNEALKQIAIEQHGGKAIRIGKSSKMNVSIFSTFRKVKL